MEYFQMFSSLTMQKKFNVADHYRLALIYNSITEIIASL